MRESHTKAQAGRSTVDEVAPEELSVIPVDVVTHYEGIKVGERAAKSCTNGRRSKHRVIAHRGCSSLLRVLKVKVVEDKEAEAGSSIKDIYAARAWRGWWWWCGGSWDARREEEVVELHETVDRLGNEGAFEVSIEKCGYSIEGQHAAFEADSREVDGSHAWHVPKDLALSDATVQVDLSVSPSESGAWDVDVEDRVGTTVDVEGVDVSEGRGWDGDEVVSGGQVKSQDWSVDGCNHVIGS